MGGEEAEETSRAHSSTPSCQKLCNCSVYLLKKNIKALFRPWVLHVDNIREEKKVKKKTGISFSSSSSSLPNKMSANCDS